MDKKHWRVLEMQDVDLAYMHAAEEVLFKRPAPDNVMIFTRVKPGISLAINQNYFLDVDDELCRKEDIHITRRRSGGRSMYFDDNYLIMSLITSDHKRYHPREKYQDTLSIIIKALESVTGKSYVVANSNDILVDGKQIGSSAQHSESGSLLVHCYIRVTDNLSKMLRYVKVDGRKLAPYFSELRPYVASVSDFVNAENFDDKLKRAILSTQDYSMSQLTLDEIRSIEQKRQTYMDRDFVKGDPTLPSKGNCDIIQGSGSDAKLKIKSLEGLVKFS